MIKIKFYGTRGSIPVCESDFSKYGGNTSCVLIECDQETYIIDAGTGIRNLGKDLRSVRSHEKIKILFTHFHQDHIYGFPFFDPCYDPLRSISLMAIPPELPTLFNVMHTQMNSNVFPIDFDKLPANIEFNQIHNEKIETIDLNHQGRCTGYKFTDETGLTLVYMVDHEHQNPIQQKYIDFCFNADILVHDGQYTESELKMKYSGWGHSSVDQAMELARKSNCGRLILTHHDPDHNDAFLDRLAGYCQSIFPDTILAYDTYETHFESKEGANIYLKSS